MKVAPNSVGQRPSWEGVITADAASRAHRRPPACGQRQRRRRPPQSRRVQRCLLPRSPGSRQGDRSLPTSWPLVRRVPAPQTGCAAAAADIATTSSVNDRVTSRTASAASPWTSAWVGSTATSAPRSRSSTAAASAAARWSSSLGRSRTSAASPAAATKARRRRALPRAPDHHLSADGFEECPEGRPGGNGNHHPPTVSTRLAQLRRENPDGLLGTRLAGCLDCWDAWGNGVMRIR